ncbi:hypothetical protein PYW08_009525 [Mythimna loreyi]|uniref:Uncharacterized protein n=1 Tax=Mythimna loreyi TaxID=667449 RepID=A0ACC2Q6A5_9NEOP|nr:hypothetical protein PYW08_009525 [Mythimna loreyi]
MRKIWANFCRKVISESAKNTYFEYFGMLLDKNEKSWASNCACKSFVEYLGLWKSGKRSAFKFGTLTIWREPRNHREGCYFCGVNVNGLNTKIELSGSTEVPVGF